MREVPKSLSNWDMFAGGTGGGGKNSYSVRVPGGGPGGMAQYMIDPYTNSQGRFMGYFLKLFPGSARSGWVGIDSDGGEVMHSSRQSSYRDPRQAVKAARKHWQDLQQEPTMASMDQEKVSRELVAKEILKIAKDLMAGTVPQDLVDAVNAASSFMKVGEELKKRRIKYDFSTSPMPIYMLRIGGAKYAIVNKKYADDADLVVGEIAVGKM